MNNHRKQLHKSAGRYEKVKPKAILQRRPEEVLCVVEAQDFLLAEWIDVELLELEDEETDELSEPIDDAIPVIEDIESWLGQPWETDYLA